MKKFAILGLAMALTMVAGVSFGDNAVKKSASELDPPGFIVAPTTAFNTSTGLTEAVEATHVAEILPPDHAPTQG